MNGRTQVIGIHLGTSYSCVGVFRNGKVEIIAKEFGYRETPSNSVMYKAEESAIYCEQVSSMVMVLTKIKKCAESYLRTTVTDAVITIPINFNNDQKQAIIHAGTIAEINLLSIISEPIAAAIAFGLAKESSIMKRNVLIFDLGFSALDISILSIECDKFEVISTLECTYLFSEDLANSLVNYFVEQFRRQHGKDLTDNNGALSRLRTAAENAIKNLPEFSVACTKLDSLYERIDFTASITRLDFEVLIANLFHWIKEPVKRTLSDAKMAKTSIHDIILVGISSHISKVQSHLQELFDGKELNTTINPEEAVVYGAAIQAAILKLNESKKLQEVMLPDVAPATAACLFPSIDTESISPLKVLRTNASTRDTGTVGECILTRIDNKCSANSSQILQNTEQFEFSEMATKAPAIGIDLGTSYSCVGVFQNGKVEIIANEYGNRKTPSCVAFTKNNRLIGDAAKNQIHMNPTNTIVDAKRLIGRQIGDGAIQFSKVHWPFEVIDVDDKYKMKVMYKAEEKTIFPEQVSSMVLTRMKEMAEGYLGTTVTDAVITVPAHFNNAQRQATIDAGTIAGLNVLRIIADPTAAAIAYGLDKQSSIMKHHVLIFDLGSGTLDVSIVSIDCGTFEVMSTAGYTDLGGEDFDNQLVNYFVEQFKRKHGKDLIGNKRALRRLRTACEHAKRNLSASVQASIVIEPIMDDIDFNESITRSEFEELNANLFLRIMEPVKTALHNAKMAKTSIHDIVLVGGSTRIPKVQSLLQEFFDGRELNKTINPDEAVAYGAAVQAAILHGDKSEKLQDVMLFDVTPISVGIEIARNKMSYFIRRNTTIPTKFSDTFTTVRDNQLEIVIKVREGERPIVKENNLLGEFKLSEIPPARRGVPNIKITFVIDHNGILDVTAFDSLSGNKLNTIDHRKGHLTRDQIDKSINENELYRREDEKYREIISVKNSLESSCYTMMAKMGDFSNIPDSHKDVISSKCNEIMKWLDETEQREKEDYELRQKEINDVCYPIITEFCH